MFMRVINKNLVNKELLEYIFTMSRRLIISPLLILFSIIGFRVPCSGFQSGCAEEITCHTGLCHCCESIGNHGVESCSCCDSSSEDTNHRADEFDSSAKRILSISVPLHVLLPVSGISAESSVSIQEKCILSSLSTHITTTILRI